MTLRSRFIFGLIVKYLRIESNSHFWWGRVYEHAHCKFTPRYNISLLNIADDTVVLWLCLTLKGFYTFLKKRMLFIHENINFE